MASTIIRPVRTSSLRSLRPHLFPNPRDSPVQTSAATENALSGDRSIPEFGPFGQSIDNKMEAEELDIPILLIQDIPKMKYHEKPLHFMSEPGISQEQYEHMILSGT